MKFNYLSRLLEVYKETGVTQKEFARNFHFSPQQLNTILHGRCKPTLDFLLALHQNLKISLDWLLLGKGTKYLDHKAPKEIGVVYLKEKPADYGGPVGYVLPLLADEIAAGPPRAVEDYPAEDFIILNEKWLPHPRNTVVLRVKGASMEPAIPDGAYVGVDLAEVGLSNGSIYAIRADGGVVIRRLYVKKDILVFTPDNPAGENRPYIYVRPRQNPIIGRVCFVFTKI